MRRDTEARWRRDRDAKLQHLKQMEMVLQEPAVVSQGDLAEIGEQVHELERTIEGFEGELEAAQVNQAAGGGGDAQSKLAVYKQQASLVAA